MPKRKFLGYNAPLGTRIAEELLTLDLSPLPDLSATLVVVPGQSAVRIVTAELAKHCPGGLLPPVFLTPGGLLHYGMEHRKRPGRMEELAVWTDVLESLDPERFDLLFPNGRTGTVRNLAADFQAFRQELTSGGWSIRESAGEFGERAEQLCALEELYLKKLAENGIEDPLAIDSEAIEDVVCFAKFRQIVVAGVSDIPLQVLRCLISIESKIPGCEILTWIGAPADDADSFDDWGMPVTEAWLNNALNFGNAKRFIHKVGTAKDAARLAAFLSVRNGCFDPDKTAAVITDPSLFPVFRQEFQQFRTKDGEPPEVYDPAGVPVRELRLYPLGVALLDFLSEGDFDSMAALLRNEDMLQYCSHGKCDDLLRALDTFRLNRLPDMPEACFLLPALTDDEEMLLKHLRRLAALRQEFESAPSLTAFLRRFFTEIFPEAEYAPVRAVSFEDEAALLNTLMERLDRSHFPASAGRLEQFRLLWQEFGSGTLYQEHHESDIAVGGTLEIPFLTQDNVILAGLNDGWLPGQVTETPFLNDRIRKALGLKDNDMRFARDAFNLHTLLASRRERRGEVHVIVPKYGPDGDQLRPSSFFFTGKSLPEDELLTRCDLLFSEPSILPEETAGDRHYHFQLKPELRFGKDEQGLPILSVTAFSAYLGSPLRYFFSRELGMSPEDYGAEDMDHRLFGTVCHEAFERLGVQVFSTPEEYEAALMRNLRESLADHFGPQLPLFVGLQQNLIEQRLKYASVCLAEAAAEGYVPVATEYKLGDGEGIVFEGARIKGKIDRIEYHPGKKILRLLDFKTGKKQSPAEAHYSITRSGEVRISDLQLPLYVLLIRRDDVFREKFLRPFGTDPDQLEIRCGYFSLPEYVTETQIVEWPPG